MDEIEIRDVHHKEAEVSRLASMAQRGGEHFREVEACCLRIAGLLQIDNLGFKRIIEKEK